MVSNTKSMTKLDLQKLVQKQRQVNVVFQELQIHDPEKSNTREEENVFKQQSHFSLCCGSRIGVQQMNFLENITSMIFRFDNLFDLLR